MPLLLTKLMNDCQLDIDFKMESADMPSTTDNLAMNVKIQGMGEQKVSLNTHALTSKTGAFLILQKVSENLGKAFAPFVEPLLPIVTAHMTFLHSKAIKKSSLAIFKSMLIAVGESQNVQLFQQAVPMYIEQIQKSLNRKDEKSVKIMIKSLANNIKALGRENETNT